MIKEQKLQNLVNNAKYIFSLIAQRDRLNSNIADLKKEQNMKNFIEPEYSDDEICNLNFHRGH